MRLIDADAFLDWLDVGHLRNPGEVCFCEADVMHMIKSRPTVDAVPVVHGEWISKQNPQWPAYSHDCCSVCGWWNTKNALCYDGNHKPGHSLNYCPNCGAKMGGEDNAPD